MKIQEHEFYVLGPTDFNQILVNRLRDLESALAGFLVERAEFIAVSLLDSVITKEDVLKTVNGKVLELNNSVFELRVRIDALRSLTDEFNEPKGE